MSILKEYIIDAVSADDYKALKRLEMRHIDFRELDFQTPALLRDIRLLEQMTGQDTKDATYTEAQRLTMLELADILRPEVVLMHASNMPFIPDVQTQKELFDMCRNYPFFLKEVRLAIKEARKIGQDVHHARHFLEVANTDCITRIIRYDRIKKAETRLKEREYFAHKDLIP